MQKLHIFDEGVSTPLCGTQGNVGGGTYGYWNSNFDDPNKAWCSKCEHIAQWACWDRNVLIRRWHERPAEDKRRLSDDRRKYFEAIRYQAKYGGKR